MAGALFAKSGKPVAAVIVFEDPVPPGGSTSGEGSGSDCDPRQFAGFEGASAGPPGGGLPTAVQS